MKLRRDKANVEKANVDLIGRSTSKKRKLTGEFLEGTESSVTEIEPSGAVSFQEAWEKEALVDGGTSLDAAIDVGQDDRGVRDLDKSRVRSILGWLVVLIAAGAIIVVVADQRSAADEGSGATATPSADSNILASPLEERAYSPVEGPVAVSLFSALDEEFIDDTGSGDVLPNTDSDRILGSYSTGTVFWAGRLHVAIASDEPLLADSQDCAITSLVTDDLVAIDVASSGACDVAFGETGDRVACRGENLILLETWPFNPDSVTEPAVATGIRTRIERRTANVVQSQRGSLELPQVDSSGTGEQAPVLSSATVINGRPGDDITVELGNVVGTCELIDRSSIEVALLPG